VAIQFIIARDGSVPKLVIASASGADALDRAAAVLKALPQPFTVAQAKRAMNTTRRVAVPLLEQLDARRITRRDDDNTRTVV
jgi:selenocysteine-specific elongation factor